MMKWNPTWVAATPGKIKKGKDRIVIIKSLKGIITLFSCAPKAEGKLKSEISVRIFGLVKERLFATLRPFVAGAVEAEAE